MLTHWPISTRSLSSATSSHVDCSTLVLIRDRFLKSIFSRVAKEHKGYVRNQYRILFSFIRL